MKRSVPDLLVLLLAAAACGPAPRAAGPAAPAPAPAISARDAMWIDSTLVRLSLRQKVAQLVMPRISGAFLPVGSEAYERAHRWVVQEGVGGLIATIGPPMEAAVKFNMLQSAADVPLLITADMEHGPGQLLNGGVILPYGLDNGSATRFPPLMAIGATGDESFAYELGRITAIEGRAVGVHMTFAPVVDVNNNPANPIINTRSYGADPKLVARMAAAHVRGLQEHGMLATAKHFPGHGDTGVDSHIQLPFITVDRARADSVELLPYRAAIDAGAWAVMSAHIAFPALTGDSLPATLSHRIMTGLLREELGFDGLIVTDAMDMGAIVNTFGATEAPVMALEAGADVLLQVMPDDVGRVIDAVVAAVRSGRLTEERIDRSVRKLLTAKMHLGLNEQRTVDLASVPRTLASPDHIAVAEEAAARSITLIRDRDGLLPIRAQRVLSVVFTGDVDPFAGRTFQRTLAERLPDLATAMLDASVDPRQIETVRNLARGADLVLFSPFIRVGAYKGDLALPDAIGTLVREISSQRPVVVTSFGNPYLLAQLPDVSTYVVAWGQWDVPQRAAARALTGAAPITGQLPIPLPPEHRIGEGVVLDRGGWSAALSSPLRTAATPRPSRLPRRSPADVGMDRRLPGRVDSLMRVALFEGAAPGAAVAIGRHGALVHVEGYGRLDPRAGFAPVTDSTIYDLASLTKVIATTSALMVLVEEGRLDLDAPVHRYLPEFSGSPAKQRVIVRDLLLHESGLPAWAPLFRHIRGRRAYLDRIVALPLEYETGTRMMYSDLGAILLGLIVERVAGQPLDVFTQRRIFGPLGMRETGFNPIWWVDATNGDGGNGDEDPGEALQARIAPTENDTVFRFRHIQGNVHDENAYSLGGVAGHAGLFSSARDLAIFAQMLLNGGEYAGERIFQERTVREFTRRYSDRSSRALGWDTPAPRSSAGAFFSESAFGHTGFTGTSLWLDPALDVFVILLTNRVNGSRSNERHAPLRRDLADLVALSITDMPVTQRENAR